MKDVKTVCAQLVKMGATRVNGAIVRSAKVTNEDNGGRVAIRLNQPIIGMVQDEEGGDWHRSEVSTAWCSIYSIAAVLRQMPETAAIVKYLIEDSEDLEMLLSWAEVDIICEPVTAGVDDEGNPLTYVNPFSDNPVERIIEHTTVYYHIVSIDLSDSGWEIVNDVKKALSDARRARVLGAKKAAKKDVRKHDAAPRRRVAVDEPEDDDADDAEEAPEAEPEAPAKRGRKA